MSAALILQRCWHHQSREAVVQCPECRRYYCRECVTEHAGRMICADCVARAAVGSSAVERPALPALAAATVVGLLFAWLIFYYLGIMLTRIPSDFFGGST